MDNQQDTSTPLVAITEAKKRLRATLAFVDVVIGQLGDQDARPTRNHPHLQDGVLMSATEILKHAPVGLEKPFVELYNILHPALVQQESNVTALLMGMQGSGKLLVLKCCLECLDQTKFHIVSLNGLIIRGNNVGFVVKEIVWQLSEIAAQEAEAQATTMTTATNNKKLEHLLRTHTTTSFTYHMSSLDEIFQLAEVDQIPILIVLDKFDAFLGSAPSSAMSDLKTNETAMAAQWQLILYHLLDRMATQGSLLCVVGLTSSLSSMASLEKHVKSQAEGTAHFIHVAPATTYKGLAAVLMSLFEDEEVENSDDDNGDDDSEETSQREAAVVLRRKFAVLIGDKSVSDGESVDDSTKKICVIFERNFCISKKILWFHRVLSVALSLYREDVRLELHKRGSAKSSTSLTQNIMDALETMGALFADSDQGTTVDLSQPHLQFLKNLSGPQVALIFAARRILACDGLKEDVPKPLTLDWMHHEYKNYQGASDRYNTQILNHSFVELLEMDVLRPSSNHTGGAPLQYEHTQSVFELDTTTLSKLPLHFPFSVDREFPELIKSGIFDCLSALKDWGMRNN